MQRENISKYLAACRYMAFHKASMFETSDLYEGGNMVLVIENIYELAKRASRKGGLPTIKEPGKKPFDSATTLDTGAGYTSTYVPETPTSSYSSHSSHSYSDIPSSASAYTPETQETSCIPAPTKPISTTPISTTPISTEPISTTTELTATEGGDDDGPATFCPDCGTKRDGLSKFCADCGHQFEDGGGAEF